MARGVACDGLAREASWRTSSCTSRSTRPSRSGSSTSTANCSGGRSRSRRHAVWAIDTGDGAISTNEPGRGINGGLTQRQGTPPERGAPINGCDFVVGVDGSVDELFQKGLDLGGTQALPLADMQGIGRVGYLLDPDGNVFGLIPGALRRDEHAGRLEGWPRRQSARRPTPPGSGLPDQGASAQHETGCRFDELALGTHPRRMIKAALRAFRARHRNPDFTADPRTPRGDASTERPARTPGRSARQYTPAPEHLPCLHQATEA